MLAYIAVFQIRIKRDRIISYRYSTLAGIVQTAATQFLLSVISYRYSTLAGIVQTEVTQFLLSVIEF
jgi:hypothetical protein